MFDTTTTKEEFVKLYEPEIEAMNCENIQGIHLSGEGYSIYVPANKDSLNNAFCIYKRMPKRILRNTTGEFQSLNDVKKWIDAQVKLRQQGKLRGQSKDDIRYFLYVCISYVVLLNLIYGLRIEAYELRFLSTVA